MPARATKTRAKKAPAKKATVKRAASTKARKAAPKKKTAAKKAPAKKAVAVKAIKAVYTKSQIMNEIAESTELKRKDVVNVFETLSSIIEGHVKSRGAGQFTLPGLLKITVNKKPATKARKGVNPFTGEPTVFKAKPARRVVKVRALKKLKEMAEG